MSINVRLRRTASLKVLPYSLYAGALSVLSRLVVTLTGTLWDLDVRRLALDQLPARCQGFPRLTSPSRNLIG
jgi:hypothetical protein